MFSENEFNLIYSLNDKSFIKREDYSTDADFDYSCDLALEMLEKGILRSPSKKPYIRNHTGDGPKYITVGKLELSIEAQDILQFKDFKAYSKSIKNTLQWGLSNRLALWGVVVGIIGLVVTIMLTK